MISFHVWSSVQRRLIEDPGFVGVRTGDDGALVLCWLPGHTPSEVAAAASAPLCEAGLLVRDEVNATTFAQIEQERERLMGEPCGLVPLYILGCDELGPNAHDIRLDGRDRIVW